MTGPNLLVSPHNSCDVLGVSSPSEAYWDAKLGFSEGLHGTEVCYCSVPGLYVTYPDPLEAPEE